MEWWQVGLWGMAGGAAIELIDLYKLVRTDDGSYEMPPRSETFWLAYLIAVAIRLAVGFAAAWALFDSNELDSAVAALGVGAGATGFLEHIGRGPRPAEALLPQDPLF